jgi:protein TonB
MHIDSLRGAVMFQESLVESTPLLRTRNRWPVFVSIAAQTTVLTLAVTIPLLHPEVIPKQALNKLDFLPAPRVKPPTPPPQPVRIVQTAPPSSAPVAPPTQAPQIPASVAEQFHTDASQVENPTIAIASGTGANSVPFAPATAPPVPHVAPAPVAAATIGPLRISEGVLAGNLITPIRAQYPAIARAAGVQGVIVIQAVISTTGTIQSVHVVSGPLMLQAAAVDAVRSARYRPYLLNHQPTEVETTFSINFRLGSN